MALDKISLPALGQTPASSLIVAVCKSTSHSRGLGDLSADFSRSLPVFKTMDQMDRESVKE